MKAFKELLKSVSTPLATTRQPDTANNTRNVFMFAFQRSGGQSASSIGRIQFTAHAQTMMPLWGVWVPHTQRVFMAGSCEDNARQFVAQQRS